ncbi:hypothetical protein L218DRAFT_193832 [Marasmius fiardii PR-910]|nr:hypothetical protein L218DRAFT_193832 [Marasmius fiardii PR-910]
MRQIVANCTLFIYEVIVNLPDEIDHIWRRKWSFLTALYIVQRYLPLFDLAIITLHRSFGANLNTQYCTLNYKIAAWSYITGVMLSEIVLTLRIWAVWHGGRLMTIVLATFFFACWVPCCIFLGRFLDAMEFINLPYPNPHGCVIGGGSTILIACWVLWMVYDIAALVMILIPGVAAFRRGGMSELMQTVYQDGVVYYALMCCG